jgi:phytanoyl-CoA hydroxylase
MDESITMNRRLAVIRSHLAQSKPNSQNSTSKSFTYTSDGILTTQQREEYEKNGFIVIRNLVSGEQLDKFKKRFQKICAEKIRVPGLTIMKGK